MMSSRVPSESKNTEVGHEVYASVQERRTGKQNGVGSHEEMEKWETSG